jgi:hypothetical protein
MLAKLLKEKEELLAQLEETSNMMQIEAAPVTVSLDGIEVCKYHLFSNALVS